MSQSKFSIAAACRIANKQRNTIKSHLASGKLSYELDENGNKVIDASELHRVYGNDCNFDEELRRQRVSNTVTQSADKPRSAEKSTNRELEQVQERLEREIAERNRERETLRDQVTNLQENLKVALEGHNRATLLLEKQKSGVGDWEQQLKQVVDRFTEEQQKLQTELREVKETATKKLGQYKKALEEERAMGLMEWLASRKARKNRLREASSLQASNKN